MVWATESAFHKKIDTNKRNAALNFAELVASRTNGDVGEDDEADPSGFRDATNILGGFAAGRGASRVGESG